MHCHGLDMPTFLAHLSFVPCQQACLLRNQKHSLLPGRPCRSSTNQDRQAHASSQKRRSKLHEGAPKQGDKGMSLYEIEGLMGHTLAAPDWRELFPGRCPGNCACCSTAALTWDMPENTC